MMIVLKALTQIQPAKGQYALKQTMTIILHVYRVSLATLYSSMTARHYFFGCLATTIYTLHGLVYCIF